MEHCIRICEKRLLQVVQQHQVVGHAGFWVGVDELTAQAEWTEPLLRKILARLSLVVEGHMNLAAHLVPAMSEPALRAEGAFLVSHPVFTYLFMFLS